MSGSEKNYDFPQKNHWRRWLWNRIAERVENPRDAVVVGLFGADGLDVDIALRRGFQPHNLVAVDRSSRAVERLRSRGVVAIEGDLSAVLMAWDCRVLIDVILADFCCGLSDTALHLIDPMVFSAAITERSVVAINLLRGRDRHDATKSWKSIPESTPMHRHRAVRFISVFLSSIATARNELQFSKGEVSEIMDWAIEQAVPTYSTYRSGTQIYDSAVFRMPIQKDVRWIEAHERAIGSAPWVPLRQKVAAARAVRTKKARSVMGTIH